MEYNTARAVPAFRAPSVRPVPLQSPPRPAVMLAMRRLDLGRYVTTDWELITAVTTENAVVSLATHRPHVVVVDWDDAGVESEAVCRAARTSIAPPMVIAITGEAPRVPAAIKSGCSSILLRPFVPNLFAARIGRMLREGAVAGRTRRRADDGTNRVWMEVACTRCSAPGAVSFDFSSRRRAWYACLACDATWLGRRLEDSRGGRTTSARCLPRT